MTNDIRELVPEGKQDLTRAEAAVSAEYPAVAPILPELLEWLRDYKWPVAHVLEPLPGSVGKPLAPHIRDVLDLDGALWKYWVICVPGSRSCGLANDLRDDLERLARSPTSNKVAEGVDDAARDVLNEYGMR